MPDSQPPFSRTFLRSDGRAATWARSPGLVEYGAAVAAMEARARAIATGEAGEMVWLLEHPPLYSAGISARETDLLSPARFPVFRTSRGGRYTYHGPGQRIAYLMLDLRARRRDARAFVQALEAWIVAALGMMGVEGRLHAGRIGVWASNAAAGGADEKIAAVGVRLRQWISFHGVSLNVSPDLEHFTGIVPCGLAQYGVTSMRKLGAGADMAKADHALLEAFGPIFGPVTVGSAPPLVERLPHP